MHEFIWLQYRLGRIDAERVQGYVPKWITQEQADEITGAACAE